jgi:hypothetical protein
MISLSELAQHIVPTKTVLFLGAGVSIPSGAPSAVGLATELSRRLAGKPASSDDLMEVSGLLEMKFGREAVVREVRGILGDLKPTGGLLSLPAFNWGAIFTTNFDRLVERAYAIAKKPLPVVRSNYEYRNADEAQTTLYKLHGCVSLDSVDGNRIDMLLTERDYDAYDQYRQTLFRTLELKLSSKDVMVVGYSLRDQHLRAAIKNAADLKRKAGAPGRIYVVVFDGDSERAALVETFGVIVAFGSIDELVALLDPLSEPPLKDSRGESSVFPLTPAIAARVTDYAHASALPPNPERMYAGAPATFADIANELTFVRMSEVRLLEALWANANTVTLTGVAGSGKTTLARRIGHLAARKGAHVWELNYGVPLDPKSWLQLESLLRQREERGILLIDDSTSQQRHVNLLADMLAEIDNPMLRVILTAQTSQWEPRTKSPRLFRRGVVETLGRLRDPELDSLLDLVDIQPVLRRLVGRDFLERTRAQRLQALRSRCSGDMFVALKYLFSTDALDTILLKEFAELPEDLQDIYRVVSGLEAAGARVHRQLVLRLLQLRADLLAGCLATLGGLIEEFEISVQSGLYGWRTRHEVIAKIVARYKFADQDALERVLGDVIEALNPTVFLERATASAICTSDFGISRLENSRARRRLLERLVAVAPTERVPRHRLIRELLETGVLGEAEVAINEAREVVGDDSPIRRYRVLLTIARATDTPGLMAEDRVAMLSEARRLALAAIGAASEDKYAYSAFLRVGKAQYDLLGGLDILDEAIAMLREACSAAFDPELSAILDDWERRRLPLHAGGGG